MSTPKDFQSDVGIKIAKMYYDVNTCADKDLLFSSSWPSMQVVYDGIAPAATISHGLGFPPLAFKYRSLGTSGADPDGVFTDVSFTGERRTLDVTSSIVYTTTGVRTVIFNLDISKSIDYGVIKTTSTMTNYDPDYGIKIVKEGKDINSTDMRDFILHSRCQSPLMLKTLTMANATQDPSFPTIYYIDYVYTETLPPFFYAFLQLNTGIWVPVPYSGQAYPVARIDYANKSIRNIINTAASFVYPDFSPKGTVTGGSIVLTRDPMFSPTTITGSY